MQFKGTCIAAEDSSYNSKTSGRIEQNTLTCIDEDLKARLKDTVDVVIPKEDYERIKDIPVGKTFAFDVREIRTGMGARFRFVARLATPARTPAPAAPPLHKLRVGSCSSPSPLWGEGRGEVSSYWRLLRYPCGTSQPSS